MSSLKSWWPGVSSSVTWRPCNSNSSAAALIEIEVRGEWLNDNFWGAHWSEAAGNPLPVGPYRAMRKRLAQRIVGESSLGHLGQAAEHPGIPQRGERSHAEPVTAAVVGAVMLAHAHQVHKICLIHWISPSTLFFDHLPS